MNIRQLTSDGQILTYIENWPISTTDAWQAKWTSGCDSNKILSDFQFFEMKLIQNHKKMYFRLMFFATMLVLPEKLQCVTNIANFSPMELFRPSLTLQPLITASENWYKVYQVSQIILFEADNRLNTLDDSGNFGSVDVFEANDGNNPYRCDLLDGNFS